MTAGRSTASLSSSRGRSCLGSTSSASRRSCRHLVVTRPEGAVGFARRVPREPQLLHLLDHPVSCRLVAPGDRSLVGHDR